MPLGRKHEPVHYTIVAMDVAKSGSRDDQLQLRMRADLRALVTDALALSGLSDAEIDINDLGDGLRLIIPAQVPPARLLDPFIPRLAAGLREHRKAAAPAARLRLRISIHMGLLYCRSGWAGQPLVHCARLLDADPTRQVLAATDRGDLVVVVSQDVYDKVVRHGYGLDPAAYRRITVEEKETVAHAWVHMPGFPDPPGLDPDVTAGDHPTGTAGRAAGRRDGAETGAATPRTSQRIVLRGSGTRTHRLGRIVLDFLMAFGAVASIGMAVIPAAPSLPPIVVPAAMLACTAWALVRARPLAEVKRRFDSLDTTVTVRVGDLFDEQGHVVVGFTDTFDTSTAGNRLISWASVQGQLVHRRYGGNHRALDRALQSALARHVPVGAEKREAKRWGKLNRYPVGTVAVIGKPGRHVFAVAYGRLGNDLVTRSNIDDLWSSLSRLWDAVYEHGERLPVAMPVVGSGLSRIDGLNPSNLVKLIVLSFLAHSHPSRLTRELRVIIHRSDLDKIDLREVAVFLRSL